MRLVSRKPPPPPLKTKKQQTKKSLRQTEAPRQPSTPNARHPFCNTSLSSETSELEKAHRVPPLPGSCGFSGKLRSLFGGGAGILQRAVFANQGACSLPEPTGVGGGLRASRGAKATNSSLSQWAHPCARACAKLAPHSLCTLATLLRHWRLSLVQVSYVSLREHSGKGNQQQSGCLAEGINKRKMRDFNTLVRKALRCSESFRTLPRPIPRRASSLDLLR